MAIVAVPQFVWPYFNTSSGTTPALSTLGMTANGNRVAFMLQVPKSGTLDTFEWRTGTVSNNPDNGLRCSFQDVNTANGLPDGTPDQYRDITGTFSANTWQTPGLITSDGTDLGTKRTVTKGDWIACVIDFVSFVAGDNITVSILNERPTPYSKYAMNNGSIIATVTPVLALKYSDGTYAAFENQVYPISLLNTYAFHTASTPDERAAKFVAPFDCRVTGAMAFLAQNTDCDLVLYSSGGSTLASGTVSRFLRGSTTTAVTPVTTTFNSTVNLNAGDTYYLSVTPTATPSTVTMATFTVPSTDHRAAMPSGSNWFLSTRTDGGSWSDTTTEWPLLGLMIDGLDDGAGGGGGGTGGSFTFVG